MTQSTTARRPSLTRHSGGGSSSSPRTGHTYAGLGVLSSPRTRIRGPAGIQSNKFPSLTRHSGESATPANKSPQGRTRPETEPAATQERYRDPPRTNAEQHPSAVPFDSCNTPKDLYFGNGAIRTRCGIPLGDEKTALSADDPVHRQSLSTRVHKGHYIADPGPMVEQRPQGDEVAVADERVHARPGCQEPEARPARENVERKVCKGSTGCEHREQYMPDPCHQH